jgi:hypothetical protein
LIRELIDRIPVDEISPAVRRIMRIRSITTLCLFGVAAAVALKYPLAGLGICICCLIVYLKPDPPGAGKHPKKVIVAPDCGLKYLPRDVAFGKMQAMVEGAKLVRAELRELPSAPDPIRSTRGR